MSTNKYDLLMQAESVEDLVTVFESEEALVRFVQASVKHAEQQRLSHKKAYLKRQLVLQKAKALGITGD